ncbi:MAG: S41 family peptidase [Bacteroidales bacterium]|nr:S41 family peptidase [Bacteroidales bacterium]
MKRREYSTLLLLLFISCLGGGEVDMQFDNHPKGNFDALWTILDRNYCFFEYKDIDWDKIYKEYSRRISSDMDNDALFKLMGQMLAELKDGHVNLTASHDITRYWEWQDDYPVNFDLSVQKHYLGNDYSIASGMKYKILEDNIVYLYYGSFSSDIGHGNLDQVLNRMAICQGVIIDVRSNGGGSLANVEKFTGRFFNERQLIGYISHKIGPGHTDFSTLYPKYVESSDRVRYQKPVVVLTNRGCYSATNEFVSIMKYAPNVTIMGDKTGGGSGLPFTSELPNGWSVRFSASPMFNAEKEHIEFGVEPDIYVNMSDADSKKNRDTIIEEARALLKNQ